MNKTVDVLDGFRPDGAAAELLLFAVPIDTWGRVCDYVNCVRQRFDPLYVPRKCPKVGSTTSTSVETTTTASTTTTISPGDLKRSSKTRCELICVV